MENLGWDALLRVPSSETEHEPEVSSLPGSCPCSCLRNMVPVLDADSPESAVLEAQSALGAVTGAVVLSAYRTVPDEQYLALVATGHSADEDLKRCAVPMIPGTIVDAVLADGIVRWVHIAQGPIAAVGMAGLRDRGHISGLVVAEFIRGSTGVGKPSAVCLHCVASTLSVVLLRSRIDEAQGDEIALARYRSVAELAVQVTHDFNNMMQGVLGNAALARMDLPEGSSAVTSLRSMEEAATRASVLSRKLLNFARDSERTGASCDLVRSSSDALDLAATLYVKNIAINRTLPDGPVPVRATDNDIQNALMMIVKGAVALIRPISGVDFIVNGGQQTCTASAVLEIRGVAQQIDDSRKVEGTRLMNGARTVMQTAGGDVDVHVEQGTMHAVLTVPVDLPQVDRGAASTALSSEKGELSGMHILALASPLPLTMLLKAAGCDVVSVASWDDVTAGVTRSPVSVVLVPVDSTDQLLTAAANRTRLGCRVVVVCPHAVVCPPEVAAQLDGILGLPLEMDEVRHALGRLARGPS